MADNPYYPPVGFYFTVLLDGEEEASGFQEVSGLSQEVAVEEIAGGGENRFKYRLPNSTKSQNLILKRGLVAADSLFAQWCNNILTSGLATPIETKKVTVSLLNESNQPLVSWQFNDVWPVKWALSDLHSQKNELVIESIELAYTYMVKLPNA